MPGRGLARAGLLDQQVVVVQPHGGALHQALSQGRERRVKDEAPELRDVLPVAKVFKKPTRIIRPTGHHAEGAGVSQVGLNASFQQFHFIWRQQLADAHRTIALVIGHVLLSGAGVHTLAQRLKIRHGHAFQDSKSSSVRATTLVARRTSSSCTCSSERLALDSRTVRGPAP